MRKIADTSGGFETNFSIPYKPNAIRGNESSKESLSDTLRCFSALWHIRIVNTERTVPMAQFILSAAVSLTVKRSYARVFFISATI